MTKRCENRTAGHICTAECDPQWSPKSWAHSAPWARPREDFQEFLRKTFAKPAARRTPEEIARLIRAFATRDNMRRLIYSTFAARHLYPYEREQIVKDTLAALVLNRFGNFDPEQQALLAYVRGAVKYQTLQYLAPGRGVETSQNLLEQIPDLAPNPEVVAIDRANLARLVRCLQKLPASMRQLLAAAEDGEKAKEAGTRLGTSPGNIRVRRNRARELLRKCMECGDEAWDVPPGSDD